MDIWLVPPILGHGPSLPFDFRLRIIDDRPNLVETVSFFSFPLVISLSRFAPTFLDRAMTRKRIRSTHLRGAFQFTSTSPQLHNSPFASFTFREERPPVP